MSTETSVGFVCLDCEARSLSDQMGKRVVWSYAPTPAGIAQIASGRPLPRLTRSSLFSHLNELACHHAESGRPFCILATRIRELEGVVRNVTLWEKTCTFFGLLFRETFTPETAVIEAPPYYLAFLAGDHKNEVERELPDIKRRLEEHLSAPVDIEISVFGPPEFVAMLERAKPADR